MSFSTVKQEGNLVESGVSIVKETRSKGTQIERHDDAVACGDLTIDKVEMNEPMMEKIVDIAREALSLQVENVAIARHIKRRLDLLYDPLWYVLVGTKFAVFGTYMSRRFAQFKIGDLGFVVLKVL